MAVNETSRSAWLVLATTALAVHGLGICLIAKLKRKKASDYLLILLSISEIAKVLVRLGNTIYCFTQEACPRTLQHYSHV